MQNNAPVGKEYKYYDVLCGLFIAVWIISEVASSKLFTFWHLVLPGAIIIFPVSYIFGDILTEVYGYARTRRIIWTGFASLLILSLVLTIIQYLPPAPSWHNQQAYEAILGFVPRIALASILGFWAGEFTNSYVLAKMKLWTGGKMLWSRTIGSTIAGQAVDTVVFIGAAFYGKIPLSVMLGIMLTLYLAKVIYEIVATPLTYWIINSLKRAEGVDIFDKDTNFSPFKL